MVKRGTSRSLAHDVYNRIRGEIFAGHLRPGMRLQPAVLSEQFDASTTVVREALALLAGERLIQSAAGRGFFVPELVVDEITDVTAVRCHVESLALSMSIERGGVEWEMRVVAAHHQLIKTPRRTPDNPDHINQQWASHHREFHEQLISGCNVPILMDMCRQLTAATELYRIWAGPSSNTAARDVDAEHNAIVDAALAGDTELATNRLVSHFRTTAEAVLIQHRQAENRLSEATGSPASKR
jgi:DNA-binding GntR family transcriptional regulator